MSVIKRFPFLRSCIDEVKIWAQIWWKWICQRFIVISLLLNSLFEVVANLCRYRFVIPSFEWRVLAHFFKAYLNITQELIQFYRWIWWVNWLDDIYTTKVIPMSIIIICADVIEDYTDDDQDVIMELTFCIVRDIVFTTYIINAFAPKQVNLGLDNSAEYRIWVCWDVSYQIMVIEMTKMSRC